MSAVSGRTRILYIQPYEGRCGPNRQLLELVKTLRPDFAAIIVFPEAGTHTLWFERTDAKIHYDLGVRVMPSTLNPAEQSRYWLAAAATILRLTALIRSEKVSLVHTNSEATFVGNIAARLAGVPAIMQVHGLGFASKGYMGELAVKAMHFTSSRLVAVSDAVQSALMRRGAQNVIRIYNGVAPSGVTADGGLEARRALGFSSSDALIACVGPINPRKGQLFLVRACALLKPRFRALRCVFAGPVVPATDASYMGRLEREVAERHLEDTVTFLGERDDIPPILAAADIVVQSSLTDAFPISVLEAMSQGKAIVASAVGGIPEQIQHGKHGLLVPPGDVCALADAIATLLADETARTELGEAARKRAQMEFNLIASTGQMRDLYLALLGRSGGRRGVERPPSESFRLGPGPEPTQSSSTE